MKKRQKSNPQFYHPPLSSPDAQNQCAKINLKRLICRSLVTQAKCVPLREPQAHVTGWRHSSVAATFAANPPRLAPAAAS
ncbi:hypothetical protein ANDA3_1774 [plant metagenome]|uniref:Uncharacterized protein n=1 Tax=plant metagenome TaxID=1297885 RepID=A0A484P6Z5_9ZZZZ